MSIKIILYTPLLHQRNVILPDDVPLSRLAPGIAKKLDLPFSERGQTIAYILCRENSETGIDSTLTLAEAGVLEQEVLILREARKDKVLVEGFEIVGEEKMQEDIALEPAHKKKSTATPTKTIVGIGLLIALSLCLMLSFSAYAFYQIFSDIPGAFPMTDITNPLSSGIKPEMVWEFSVANTIMEAPVVDSGTVYFGVLSDDTPNFYALDAATGEMIWQFAADGSISWTPSLTQEMVFFSSENGYFYALNRADGSEQWRFDPVQRDLDSGCNVCLLKFRYSVVADGIVYVGSLDKHLYALDAVTGVELWRLNTNGSILDKPTMTDGVLYFGTANGIFYAVDAKSGDQLYQVKTVRESADSMYGVSVSSPIVDGDVIYITNGDALALDRRTGEQLWRFTLEDDWRSILKRPLADDDHIYIMDGQSAVYALEKNSGDVVWKYLYPDDYIYGELVLNDGIIYFGDYNNRLVAIDTETGKQLTIYNLGKLQSGLFDEVSDSVFTPAIDGDTAYVGWANQMNAIQLETP